MGDPVVADRNSRGVPAESDAGGGRLHHIQVCGCVRDWRERDEKKKTDKEGKLRGEHQLIPQFTQALYALKIPYHAFF